MSQYPYNAPQPMPYGGYGYYQNPLDTLLAPAKRASIFMFIMGGLMLPCGLLMGLVSFADFSQLTGPQAAQLELLEDEFSKLGWSVKGFFQILGALFLVPGLILIVLGVMVRRGGMGSIITSIILCCLMALLAGFGTISGVLQAGQGGQAILGACIWGGILALLIITLVFLFQAARNSGQLSNYRAQYQNQLYMAQQNQQMYGYPQQQYPTQQPQQWGQQQQQQWPPNQNWPPPQNPT